MSLFFKRKLQFPKIISSFNQKFKSKRFYTDAFLNDSGKIKAIVFAIFADSLKNLIAKEFCCPKGGFPQIKTDV